MGEMQGLEDDGESIDRLPYKLRQTSEWTSCAFDDVHRSVPE